MDDDNLRRRWVLYQWVLAALGVSCILAFILFMYVYGLGLRAVLDWGGPDFGAGFGLGLFSVTMIAFRLGWRDIQDHVYKGYLRWRKRNFILRCLEAVFSIAVVISFFALGGFSIYSAISSNSLLWTVFGLISSLIFFGLILTYAYRVDRRDGHY